jgi:cysteine synthase
MHPQAVSGNGFRANSIVQATSGPYGMASAIVARAGRDN